MTEPRIHMRHVRAIKQQTGRGQTCTDSIRRWCAQNGVDLKQLSSEGIPGETALRIGGAFALAALEIARKEQAEAGNGR